MSMIKVNIYYFTTGERKNNGLEKNYLIDPGSTPTIANYPTLTEMQQFNPGMMIFYAIKKNTQEKIVLSE